MGEAVLRMPRLGETMDEGEIASWLVEPGAAFERGDALAELETDKTVVELPALGAGTLLEALADAGDRVAVGAPIARIDIGDGPDWTADGATEGPANDVAGDTNRRDANGRDVGDVARGDRHAVTGPVRATPAARHAARERGIALDTLVGSGRGGRVEVRDVERAPGGAIAAAIPGARPFAFDGWHVALAGPASGPPVLLLHGFAGDHTTWAPVAHALAKGGCRVLVADLPGHGANAREARAIEDLSAGADALLAELIGETPVHLVAHSLGAVPALALAGSVPCASLTLIAPAGIGLSIDATFVRGMAAPRTPGELSHLLARLGDRVPLSPEALAALHAELARGRLRELADAVLGETGQAIDLVPAIERIARTLPTRVLSGHRDRVLDWRDVLRLPPDVAVHHFPDAGHMPHRDDARRVAPVLLNAVRSATTTR